MCQQQEQEQEQQQAPRLEGTTISLYSSVSDVKGTAYSHGALCCRESVLLPPETVAAEAERELAVGALVELRAVLQEQRLHGARALLADHLHRAQCARVLPVCTGAMIYGFGWGLGWRLVPEPLVSAGERRQGGREQKVHHGFGTLLEYLVKITQLRGVTALAWR